MTETAMRARWEHGSDFAMTQEAGTLASAWCERPHGLWGSGRDAMRALLQWGRRERGWTRVQMPSFYCQDVVVALARELPVALYPDSPDEPAPRHVATQPGDVVVAVNLLGTRTAATIECDAPIIEDHSHDPFAPWADQSTAEWAVASLRKTLPLPDGGVVWSPKGEPLPVVGAPTDAHLCAAFDRLAGMVLKGHYLAGHDVAKDSFRARLVAGERSIADAAISGISPFSRDRLPTLPARQWRERRLQNLAVFSAALGRARGVRLLPSTFAATLVFDREQVATRVRAALVEQRVYPATLWSLHDAQVAGIPDAHRDLSRRVLTLHCDFRYGPDDMQRVAAIVEQALSACDRPPAAR
jgi:hypothetical protein